MGNNNDILLRFLKKKEKKDLSLAMYQEFKVSILANKCLKIYKETYNWVEHINNVFTNSVIAVEI